MATVGNYEYGLFWYFLQDGTIQFEGKLTGSITPGKKKKKRILFIITTTKTNLFQAPLKMVKHLYPVEW
jgi:Cu2+-containing amine oxidase